MNSVLLIVDIQNDYFDTGALPLVGSLAAADNARRALAHFRHRRQPVVHIRHEALRPGASYLLPGTHGAAIHPAVAPLPDETVILKHHPNSFRETALLDTLRALECTHLVIVGMMTHMCVDMRSATLDDPQPDSRSNAFAGCCSQDWCKERKRARHRRRLFGLCRQDS